MQEFRETGLVVHDLVNGNSEYIENYLEIYQALFPQYARYMPVMRRRAETSLDPSANERWHQWLLFVDNRPAGIVGFLYNKRRNIGLLMDFAIYKEFRARSMPKGLRFAHGILNLAMQELIRDAQDNGCETPLCMAAEVEHPALVKKYREYDFFEYEVEYFEPPFTPELAEIVDDSQNLDKLMGYGPMHIGAFRIPGYSFSPNHPETIKTVLLAFLEDHYRLPADHWLIRKLIQEIPA